MYVISLKILLRPETNLMHLNKQSLNYNFLFYCYGDKPVKSNAFNFQNSCKLIFWASQKRYMDLLVNNFVYKYLYARPAFRRIITLDPEQERLQPTHALLACRPCIDVNVCVLFFRRFDNNSRVTLA